MCLIFNGEMDILHKSVINFCILSISSFWDGIPFIAGKSDYTVFIYCYTFLRLNIELNTLSAINFIII